MKLIAHRCGTDRFAQLSIPAARHSFALGADYVEFDLRQTADGELVISHDPNGLMLFGDPRPVSALSRAEFRLMAYKEDATLLGLSLEDMLRTGNAPFVLHMKETGQKLLALLLSLLRCYQYEDKVIRSTRSLADAAYLRALAPHIEILGFMKSPNHLVDFARSHVSYIRLWENWVTAERVAQIHVAGKRCWVMAGVSEAGTTGYTDAVQFRLWQSLGVDGVLINEITFAKTALAI